MIHEHKKKPVNHKMSYKTCLTKISHQWRTARHISENWRVHPMSKSKDDHEKHLMDQPSQNIETATKGLEKMALPKMKRTCNSIERRATFMGFAAIACGV